MIVQTAYKQASWLPRCNREADPNRIWSITTSAIPSLVFTHFRSFHNYPTTAALGPCLFKLLVKFVSSRLHQFHKKLMVMKS